MTKQLLLLEDLGIPKNEFEKLVASAAWPYELIWESEDALAEQVEVLITIKKTVDQSVLNQYPNLKMVAVAFTGFDHVDLSACRQKNIAVYNVPDYSTYSVAELAIGHTIALLRAIPTAHHHIQAKKWQLQPGLELAGKTVGILGTGKIGLATAHIFKAFGCKLIGWSRSEKEEFIALGGEYISEKSDFFARADVISVHLPLNDKTTGIVGKNEFWAMKKTAFLINTARGPIVDESALINALKNKEIAGAGLDVFAQEPLAPDNELRVLDNTILTPHIAYKTAEALRRRAQVTVQNITSFLQKNPTNRVDK